MYTPRRAPTGRTGGNHSTRTTAGPRAPGPRRVHGVAASGRATAAKPATAGAGTEGPAGAEPSPARTSRRPSERAHGEPSSARGRKGSQPVADGTQGPKGGWWDGHTISAMRFHTASPRRRAARLTSPCRYATLERMDGSREGRGGPIWQRRKGART